MTTIDDLTRFINEREQVKRKFDESLNKLESMFTVLGLTSDFDLEFSKAADKASRLFKVDEKVNDFMFAKVTDRNEIETEFDITESFRDRWNDLVYKKDKLKAETSSLRQPEVGLKVQNGKYISDIKYRLSQLEMCKFDGSIKNWIGFWAQFRKIHESSELDNEDKVQYLLQSTVAESPAHNLIKSYPPSACNYVKAVQQLKRRFGKEELLIELYVRELLDIALIQSTNNQKTLILRDLYDKLETQLRSLESLGVTSAKYAYMLYPLIESCLPESILREWERRRPTECDDEMEDGSSSETNRLKQLMNFLRKEVESEERLTLVKQSFSSRKNWIIEFGSKVMK